WRAPFERWAETPALTRWFLVSESIAHLDHLVATGAARRLGVEACSQAKMSWYEHVLHNPWRRAPLAAPKAPLG
ncbi:hypothetical protein, partial [Olsenella uli]|uniref:hypothetical protein n=1 Tax=Olsenella uli TaxID=133926 RepID=UPI00195AEFBD